MSVPKSWEQGWAGREWEVVGGGGDPAVLVLGSSSEREHTISHTLAAGRVLSGVAEMTVSGSECPAFCFLLSVVP